jgi:hypothetical protein
VQSIAAGNIRINYVWYVATTNVTPASLDAMCVQLKTVARGRIYHYYGCAKELLANLSNPLLYTVPRYTTVIVLLATNPCSPAGVGFLWAANRNGILISPEARTATSEANDYVVIAPTLNIQYLPPTICANNSDAEAYRGRRILVVRSCVIRCLYTTPLMCSQHSSVTIQCRW